MGDLNECDHEKVFGYAEDIIFKLRIILIANCISQLTLHTSMIRFLTLQWFDQ